MVTTTSVCKSLHFCSGTQSNYSTLYSTALLIDNSITFLYWNRGTFLTWNLFTISTRNLSTYSCIPVQTACGTYLKTYQPMANWMRDTFGGANQ